MESKISAVLLLALCSTHCVQSQFTFPGQNFSCEADAPGQPLNLKYLSGTWYEVLKVAGMNVMDCLNVSVPETAISSLDLDLEYILTVNKREAVKESVGFPWDEQTQNSIFILHYSELSVTYKIMYTDYKNLTVICGYANFATLPIFKVFSRTPKLHEKLEQQIKKELEKFYFKSYIWWTDQSPAGCNAAVRPAVGALTVITLAIAMGLTMWNWR